MNDTMAESLISALSNTTYTNMEDLESLALKPIREELVLYETVHFYGNTKNEYRFTETFALEAES